MISYCGLNCIKCEAYKATLEDNDDKRAKVAEKWSVQYHAEIKKDQINCTGCKSTDGVQFFFCEQVCEIRKCCMSKQVENCAACDEYICDTLAGFIKLAPEAGRALAALRKA